MTTIDEELSLLRDAIEFLPEGVAVFDARDRFVLWNRKYAEFYALGAHLLKKGRPFEDYLRELLKLGQTAATAGREEEWLAERMARHRLPSSFHEHQIIGGRWVRVEERRLADGGTIGIRIDITEARKREEQLAFLARCDALTGLANRFSLREVIEEALVTVSLGGSAAVVCIDLDRFKDVNDAFGHAAGDELLRHVGDRLLLICDPDVTIARLGGDEFALVLPELASAESAFGFAERLVEALSQPYDLSGQCVVVGASAGVALLPLHGNDPDTLLRHADIALYDVKANGRGVARVFEPVMNLRVQMRRAVEADLRQAIGTPAIEVHYQPVVRLATGRMIGVEALVRWRDPSRGLVLPGAFIDVAETTGLVVPLGEQVLRTACRLAARNPDLGRMAVNLSPAQFHRPGLVHMVEAALKDACLDPSRLEMEITESILFSDSQANVATLHDLKSLGVAIALDDFGTGYSSLTQLRSFPFDRIKIDRSFVAEIGMRQDCRAIVKAIVGLAADIGIAVTAEGVETMAQRDLLLAEGCLDGQGFLFGRPAPAADANRQQTVVRAAG